MITAYNIPVGTEVLYRGQCKGVLTRNKDYYDNSDNCVVALYNPDQNGRSIVATSKSEIIPLLKNGKIRVRFVNNKDQISDLLFVGMVIRYCGILATISKLIPTKESFIDTKFGDVVFNYIYPKENKHGFTPKECQTSQTSIKTLWDAWG